MIDNITCTNGKKELQFMEMWSRFHAIQIVSFQSLVPCVDCERFRHMIFCHYKLVSSGILISMRRPYQ